MSTRRKKNRFLNAKRDGNSYTLKPEAQSQYAAAYRRAAQMVEASCENCETALR